MTSIENKTILCLDDDEIILVALRETIEPEGYEVIAANTPAEALELIKEKEFAVIMSDQRMPEMTGLEFFNHVKEIQPHSSRILITGVLSLKTIINAVNEGEIYRFLSKPWIREELIATIHNAFQRYGLVKANEQLTEDTLHLNESLAEANKQLGEKLKEVKRTNDKLDRAHLALGRNFDHALELSYRLIESYHPLLGKESASIVQLCQLMIDTGNFTPEEAQTLKVSAWLKNIGYVTIHRDLIHKYRSEPSLLTDEEISQIRNAPEVAQSMVSFVEHLGDVGRTIRAQYERWDGQGYPDGLAANLIPQTSRYLAVATWFVESGLSREDAIDQIVQLSGKAFDPDAVRLFTKATGPAKIPGNIREILFNELTPGMTLARDIYSPSGLLLIPEGQQLDELTLGKIANYNFINPITQRILVFN